MYCHWIARRCDIFHTTCGFYLTHMYISGTALQGPEAPSAMEGCGCCFRRRRALCGLRAYLTWLLSRGIEIPDTVEVVVGSGCTGVMLLKTVSRLFCRPVQLEHCRPGGAFIAPGGMSAVSDGVCVPTACAAHARASRARSSVRRYVPVLARE